MCFLGNIYFYRNLQFINNVIIIKTKVVLPRAYATLADLAILFVPLLTCFDHNIYLLSTHVNITLDCMNIDTNKLK